MTKDMTNGSSLKLIAFFSFPIFIGSLFQQFYNMADTLIVGRTLGPISLAAVGATGSINFLILGFANGIATGFAVIPSQRFGAGDEDGLRKSICTSVWIGIIITAILTLISVLLSKWLLIIMHTPEDIFEMSWQYSIIIFAGLGATMFYNMIASIIRALGDGKTPLIFLIFSSILNIILDFVFILVFKMGVRGAAIATVISQLVSAILCLFFVKHNFPILNMNKNDWKFDNDYAKQHLKIGLPMGFQFSITALGVMIVQSTLNSFGSNSIAAFTAANRIDITCSEAVRALGTGISTYVAQNYGAKRIDRVHDGLKNCVMLLAICAVLGGAVAIIFAKPITYLFVGDADKQIFEQAQIFLNSTGIMYFPLGVLITLRSTLQALGKSTMPLFAGVTEVVLRGISAKILVIPFGYLGVCLASPCAWLGAQIMITISYFVIIKKIDKQFNYVSTFRLKHS